MYLFEVEKITQVDFEDMNEIHLEEILLVNELNDYLHSPVVENYKVEEYLKQFAMHVEEHFAFEESMMQETQCPILGCHKEEHQRVRKIMLETFQKYAKNRDILIIVNYFEKEFKPWIENHLLTMDTVTAKYLIDPLFFQGQV